MVKAVAVTPSTSAHEMVRELVDDEADAAESPSGEEKNVFVPFIYCEPHTHQEFQHQY